MRNRGVPAGIPLFFLHLYPNVLQLCNPVFYEENMRSATRIIGIIAVLLLVFVVVIGAYLIITIRRPFPKTNGTITAVGLQAEVNIYRDEYGIPHIYAENEHDLFFAQGYTHAQDRFWQMEFWRHVGQGRISEIAGDATLESDKFIRTMGWNRLAADSLTYYETESPEMLAVLEAYSQGVNAYIDENRDSLSLNVTILGLANEPWEIEPWTLLNTLTWAMVMADDLSGNWSEEIDRAELVKELGEAQVASLLPGYPYATRPVIAPTDSLLNPPQPQSQNSILPTTIDWQRVNLNLVGRPPENGFALGDGPFVGSNNWVVSGQFTQSGLPLLANDPHLGIQMPSIWYEIGLHAPGWDVTGFSFAGVPGVIIGHNNKIAWGVTNVGPDVQDLYIEKINPSNPRQYEYEGEWQDMEIIQEVIKVNGGEDVTLEVLVTRHGPIISDLVDGTSDVLAMRWTAADSPRLLQSVFLLNQAQNFEQFREALRYWDVPSQNVVYADVEGNIGYQMPGRIPIRPNSDGLTPVPGWTGDHEWQGWIPYDELPTLYNPEQGYIVTANHAVVDQDYPYFIAFYWADGDRGQRITDMIEEAIANGKMTADDIAAIQFDSHLLMADDYIPLLNSLSSNDAQVQAALERLRGWDRQMRRDSVPAAIYAIFEREMAYNVLADDIGEDNVEEVINRVFLHQLATQPNAVWWDDSTTESPESPQAILLQSLDEAVTWLEENLGGDMNDWTWGRLHTATFVSNPLGQSGIGLIEAMVNRGPFPSDGSGSTVNSQSWRWSDPAGVTSHPSMRMIVDMSNFDQSRAVMPTGQSGHPYHSHYDDMMTLWLNGLHHPMIFSQEAVEAASVDHLILKP